jgi:hypothetical protein
MAVRPEPTAGRSPQRSARRRSRELAVQGLYQWLVSRDDAGLIEAHLAQAPDFGKADREHFSALLHGVIRDLDALHEAISPHLDRTVAELSPVEHATLLVGYPPITPKFLIASSSTKRWNWPRLSAAPFLGTSMACSTAWRKLRAWRWRPDAPDGRVRESAGLAARPYAAPAWVSGTTARCWPIARPVMPGRQHRPLLAGRH